MVHTGLQSHVDEVRFLTDMPIRKISMKLEVANSMTAQELFDYAVNKIVEQKVRSAITYPSIVGAPITMCSYKSGEGVRCFVGWLLDGEDHDLMNSSMHILGMVERGNYRDKIPKPIKANAHLFRLGQIFHDAETQGARENALSDIIEYGGVDIETNPAYQKWIELGSNN